MATRPGRSSGAPRTGGFQPPSVNTTYDKVKIDVDTPIEPNKAKSPFKETRAVGAAPEKAVDEGSSDGPSELELDEKGQKVKKEKVKKENTEEKFKSKRPAGIAFYQQSWNAWRPLLGPFLVIILFGMGAFFFILTGAVQLGVTSTVQEYTTRYDHQCTVNSWETYNNDHTTEQNAATCTVDIDVKKKMASPIYFYYELDNFFQAHRRFLTSYSEYQLRNGETTSSGDLQYCTESSFAKKSDTTDPRLVSLTTTSDNDYLNPCGRFPMSVFNDTMYISTDGTTATAINFKTSDSSWSHRDCLSPSGVAWASDSYTEWDGNDKRYTKQNNLGVWTNELEIFRNGIEDERFQVWMRPAASPWFRKLYGVIEQDLEAGTYKVVIHNRYPATWLHGRKSITLSTVTAFGGANYAYGIYAVTLGVILAILFVIALLCALVMPFVRPMDPEKVLEMKLAKMAKLKKMPKVAPVENSEDAQDGENEGDVETPPVAPDTGLKCEMCGKAGDMQSLKQCMGCKDVAYCSEQCQKRHWQTHKPACQAKQAATKAPNSAQGPAQGQSQARSVSSGAPAARSVSSGAPAARSVPSGAPAATSARAPATLDAASGLPGAGRAVPPGRQPSRGRGGVAASAPNAAPATPGGPRGAGPSPQAPAPRPGRGAGAPQPGSVAGPPTGASPPAKAPPGAAPPRGPPPAGRGGPPPGVRR